MPAKQNERKQLTVLEVAVAILLPFCSMIEKDSFPSSADFIGL